MNLLLVLLLGLSLSGTSSTFGNTLERVRFVKNLIAVDLHVENFISFSSNMLKRIETYMTDRGPALVPTNGLAVVTMGQAWMDPALVPMNGLAVATTGQEWMDLALVPRNGQRMVTEEMVS